MAFALSFFITLPATAATLIYRLEFQKIGDAVNDPHPRFGYLFVDSESGNVSSIIVLIDPVSRNAYYTAELISARYFQATPALGRRSPVDVVAGSSGAGDGDFAALQISGRNQRFFSVGRGQRVRLAPFLTGYLLLSGADTRDEARIAAAGGPPPHLPLSGADTRGGEAVPLTAEKVSAQFGFVGYARAEARFQRTATRSFGNRETALAEIIKIYTDALEAIGIETGSGANPSPTPRTSPSPRTGALPIPLGRQ